MEKNKFLVTGSGLELQNKLNDIISTFRNNDKDVEYRVLGKDDKGNHVVEVITYSYDKEEERPLNVVYNSAILTVPAGREVDATNYLRSEYEPLGVNVILNFKDESDPINDELFYSFTMKRRTKNKTIEL